MRGSTPRTSRRGRTFARSTGAVTFVAALVLLGACNRGANGPLPQPTESVPTATASSTESTGGTATASPSDQSATPTDQTATPGGTASPGTFTPGGTASPLPTTPVSCTTALPRRLGRTTAAPPRTTEVVTLVSDGRTLTPGTSQQTTFEPPKLTAADGAVITDPNTVALVAELLRGGRNQILTARPESPDTGLDATKRPYDSPGLYAIYNASGLLTAQVTVLCSGQEQVWEFEAEANPVSGTVNCAVEPARSNAVARTVYQTSC